MSNSISNNILHFTVGTAFSAEAKNSSLDSALDTSHEFRLLKAALLYADRITFCSASSSSFLSLMKHPEKMNEAEKLNWFLDVYKELGYQPKIDEIAKFIDEYKTSRLNRRQNYRNYLSYQQAFAKYWNTLEQMAKRAGLDEFNTALNSGLVEFEGYGNSKNFLPRIYDALIVGNTYLLVDDGAGNLLNETIKFAEAMNLDTSIVKTSVVRAKQASLSSDLFSKLPLFDQASVSEIIDIRKELSRPLIRFRAAIVGFSKEIENAPWDEEFSQEVEQILVSHIKPAVLDIEDNYKSNKGLLEIIKRSLTTGIVTTSALGIGLSALSQLPDVSAGLSITAGIVSGAYDAFRERRLEREKLEKNQLYFYYKAGETLAKKDS